MKSEYSERSTGTRPPSRRPSFAGAPVTKWLLIVLAVFFLIDVSGRSSASLGYVSPYLALDSSVFFQVWRWVTYPLVNLNMGEWLFSVIVLFSFGKLLEPALGSRRYAVLLAFTTLVGAFVYGVMIATSQLPLTGASGLAIAILVAVALLYPEQEVQLMIPPMPLKVKNLVMGLIGVMVVLAIAQRADPASTLAQLSAIGVSFLCMKNKHWLDIGTKKSVRKSTPTRSELPSSKKKVPKEKPRGMKARTILNMEDSKREAEINIILEKVSAEGIGALTEDEREILKFASKK